MWNKGQQSPKHSDRTLLVPTTVDFFLQMQAIPKGVRGRGAKIPQGLSTTLLVLHTIMSEKFTQRMKGSIRW